MQKQLKNKLARIEKDQLIEIIETLCNDKETERLLKLMLMPTKSGVDRLIREFSGCSEVFVSSSCSERAYAKMIDAMKPIYAVLKYADGKLSAYIIFEVYQAALDSDLFELECADFVYDLLEDLRFIIENDADSLSDEEVLRYKSIIEGSLGVL